MPSQSKTQSGSGEDNHDLLEFVIDNGRNITERDVRPLAHQLARTLSLIHAHGVVHRSVYNTFLPK
jgi:serine/threonine protein kinase